MREGAEKAGFPNGLWTLDRIAQLIRQHFQVKYHSGYVYLVKSGRFFKLGKTNAAGRREYELGIQLPEKVKTVHVITTDDAAGIEAYWHKRFAGKPKKGEWFQLTQADVSAFKRRKFM